ncbi:DNA-binding protein [Listeria seeligeri]|nr:DNA-binding protein [Listeria seeligeri]
MRKHNKATYMVRPWSEKEDEFIKKYYATVKTIQIAERLRRSPSAIKSRAWALGVSKK